MVTCFCFEINPTVSIVKEKNSTKFIFKQILNTVFGVFLKIDNRAFTDLTNKMQQTCRYSQPKEIRTRRLGTAHSTKALFLS